MNVILTGRLQKNDIVTYFEVTKNYLMCNVNCALQVLSI